MRLGALSSLCGILLIAAIGCGGESTGTLGSTGARGAAEGAEATDEEATASGEDELVPQQGEQLAAAPPAVSPCSAAGLVLCFTFEGTTTDQVASLIPNESANVTYVPGREGQAAAFAPNTAVRFAPNALFDLPPASATIEAWVKRAPSASDAVVFDDDARFSLTIDAGGHVWCKSSGGVALGATVLPIDQWVHVACVIDGTSMRAYAGGVVDAVGTGGVVASPASTAAIGGNAPSGEPFVGLIDSLRVFGVARAPEEIAAAAK